MYSLGVLYTVFKSRINIVDFCQPFCTVAIYNKLLYMCFKIKARSKGLCIKTFMHFMHRPQGRSRVFLMRCERANLWKWWIWIKGMDHEYFECPRVLCFLKVNYQLCSKWQEIWLKNQTFNVFSKVAWGLPSAPSEDVNKIMMTVLDRLDSLHPFHFSSALICASSPPQLAADETC